MHRKTLLTAALLASAAPLALASAGVWADAAAAPGAPTAPAADDYEALVAEFDAAVIEFKAKLKAADKATRRELRKNNPAKTYWPRFVAMSSAGEGRATLWMALNVTQNKDIRSKERGAALTPLYETLVSKHIAEPWFIDVVKGINAQKKYLGNEAAVAMFEAIVESSKADKVNAAALFFAAYTIGSDDPDKGRSYLERISKDYPKTTYGTAVTAMTTKPAQSEVGQIAPNFYAEAFDGFEFSLEDYRGKVVVLDFYGFW
ncbi:MAG: hypothetical protein AAF957_22680 [Planctomycetota bacterium]